MYVASYPPANIPPLYTDIHFQVISNLLKKLRDKLAGGNRRDPFTALPLEIAHLILSLLTFKQLA